MIGRRAVLGGLGAAALALPVAGLSAPRPRRIKPARLHVGDVVGLVAPAGFVADRFGLEQVTETIRAMGLVPKPAPHLLERYGYLAGTDKTRAADLNAMFGDKDVRGVFAVRGGWGTARMLPHLDFDLIRANPKLLIGSSDITALHMAFAARAGFPTVHGPNAAHSWRAPAWEAFRKLVFEADMPTYSGPAPSEGGLAQRHGRIRTFRLGKARGRLLGGNLSVLSALVGTPYLPDFTGAILFMEDTNEAEYRIDRMLTQLSQSGLLGSVAGVVFGQCTNCSNPGSPYGNFTVYEVMEQHFAPLGVPAFQGAGFGHIARQLSIPVGVDAEIDAEAGTIRVLEPVVS